MPNDTETGSAPAPAEGTLINLSATQDRTTTAPSVKKNDSTASLPAIPPRSFEMNGNFKTLETNKWVFLTRALFQLGLSIDSSTSNPILGSKIDELFLESDDDFDPRSEGSSIISNNARNGTEPVSSSMNTVFPFCENAIF